MVPSTATPSEEPNWVQVSDSDAAAPARSGGAEPTISPVDSATSGVPPRLIRKNPVTSAGRPPVAPAWVNRSRPATATIRPAAITYAGRYFAASFGVSVEAITEATTIGSIHRPATSGDRPLTS